MRVRTLIAAVGAVTAACSTPRPAGDPAANSTISPNRDLHLGGLESPDGRTVSDLEAGRVGPSSPGLAPSPDRLKARPRTALLSATLAVPKLATTSSVLSAIESAAQFKEAPPAAEVVVAASAPVEQDRDRPMLGVGGGLLSRGNGQSEWPGAAGRGPGIIIRGARGGIDDDCDERHPRFRGPIAINSLAPRFPRGGIR